MDVVKGPVMLLVLIIVAAVSVALGIQHYSKAQAEQARQAAYQARQDEEAKRKRVELMTWCIANHDEYPCRKLREEQAIERRLRMEAEAKEWLNR